MCKPHAKITYSNAARAVKTTFFSMFLKFFPSHRDGLNSSRNRSICIGVTFNDTQSTFARANGGLSLVVEVECDIAVSEGIHEILRL